jgi:hypothetical protein
MVPREVLVVGETPSLGRSVRDLLESANVRCRLVSDLSTQDLEAWTPGQEPLVLVACNEAYCRTARRWARGELQGSELVVVGARDPELRGVPGARVVPLPLQREPLLTLLRDLISESPPAPS